MVSTTLTRTEHPFDRLLRIWVSGNPITQGSKRAFTNRSNGKPIMVENNSQLLRPWREAIQTEVRALMGEKTELFNGDLCCELHFFFARPKSHFRTGKHADKLKDTAPAYVSGSRYDLDKLTRAVFDGLTATAIVDDGMIVQLQASKRYSSRPGCEIIIRELV